MLYWIGSKAWCKCKPSESCTQYLIDDEEECWIESIDVICKTRSMLEMLESMLVITSVVKVIIMKAK